MSHRSDSYTEGLRSTFRCAHSQQERSAESLIEQRTLPPPRAASRITAIAVCRLRDVATYPAYTLLRQDVQTGVMDALLCVLYRVLLFLCNLCHNVSILFTQEPGGSD